MRRNESHINPFDAENQGRLLYIAKSIEKLLDGTNKTNEIVASSVDYATHVDKTNSSLLYAYLWFGDKTGLYNKEIEAIESFQQIPKGNFFQFIRDFEGTFPEPRYVSYDCHEVLVSVAPVQTMVYGRTLTGEFPTDEVEQNTLILQDAVNSAIADPGRLHEELLLGRDY